MMEAGTWVRQYTVGPDDEGVRLDRWFKRHLPDIPFALVARWARTGELRIDGARANPSDRIAAGQAIRVPPAAPPSDAARLRRNARPLSPEEEAFARSLVIHRDPAALVIDKPPGLATQGGTGTRRHVDGLLDALQFEAESRPRLVHRLDKDTSGVLLLARSPGAAAFFSKRFAGRSARKTYWALVIGKPHPADGMVELPLAKQPGTGGEKMHVDEENGQVARTRYRIIDYAGDRVSLVELMPYTGRTHQLRAHMAAIGHPIVGDGKYGGREAMLTGSISRKLHLHARRLRIDEPDGGQLDVSAELPEHFATSLAQLGLEARDLPPDEGPPPANREQKKVRARAHAKSVRKARRGERRTRSR